MQCCHYLAAVTAVENVLDAFLETRRKFSRGAIADWIAENDIESEDLAFVTTSEVRTRIEILIQQYQPHFRKAA